MPIRPMLASPATTVPQDSDWTLEIKWDGYRIIGQKTASRVALWTRNENDVTSQYPTIAKALNRLSVRSVTLDGEIVALDQQGRPSFQALQHRASTSFSLAYYVFDLLEIDGRDLTMLPLDARREELRHLSFTPPILRSEPLPGSPAQIIKAVKRLKLEGVVAKRRRSLYRPGKRSDDWVKVRFGNRQEFVVGGYRPDGSTFDALLVGYYDGKRLMYAAKVRAGFTPAVKRELMAMLTPLQVARCPFANLPSERKGRWGEGLTAEDMAEIQWVRPAAVIDVAFVEWTSANVLRHPGFVGVRSDKSPRDIQRET